MVGPTGNKLTVSDYSQVLSERSCLFLQCIQKRLVKQARVLIQSTTGMYFVTLLLTSNIISAFTTSVYSFQNDICTMPVTPPPSGSEQLNSI